MFTSSFPPAVLRGLRPSQASGAIKWVLPFKTLASVLKREAGSKQYEIIYVSISPLVTKKKKMLVMLLFLFVSVNTSHWEFALLTAYYCLLRPTKTDTRRPVVADPFLPGPRKGNTYETSRERISSKLLTTKFCCCYFFRSHQILLVEEAERTLKFKVLGLTRPLAAGQRSLQKKKREVNSNWYSLL